MPHAIGCFVAIEIFDVPFHSHSVCSGEAARNMVRRNEILGSAVNFHAIAGAEQQRLVATAAAQNAVGLGVAGETLPCFQVRIVMTEPDAKQIHGVCVWAVNVIPQRRVSAALNPMMQSAATRFGANQRK